jgi:hypothetical protein
VVAERLPSLKIKRVRVGKVVVVVAVREAHEEPVEGRCEMRKNGTKNKEIE